MIGNYPVRFGKGVHWRTLVHPFIVAGQIATAYYFAHFLIILPLLGIIDNWLSEVGKIYYGTK